MRRTPVISWVEVSPLLILIIPVLCLIAPEQARTTALGMTASTIAFVMFVPQAFRVWRTRHDAHALVGLSLSTASARGCSTLQGGGESRLFDTIRR